MKNLAMIMALAFTSTVALAAAPSAELMQVTRALVNNPDVVTQLKQNGIDHMTDFTLTNVKPGVFQYDMVLKRFCECLPATATVSIVEDMTSSYADGPITYSSTIDIKKGT